MAFSKLALGSKLVFGAGILMVIDSFLHWQEVSYGPISAGVSMWHGWGVLVGLLLLAVLAWEAARFADVKFSVGPLSPSMLTLVLSGLLALFTLIKVISNDFVTIWAWIGLVLSLGVAAGAWLNMQAAGETLGDLKSSMSAAASSATAARTSQPTETTKTEAPEAGSGPVDPAS